jgi:ArsR family transcriptional regulator
MDRYTSAAGRLKAISHPARLEVLDLLRQGEMCVCHIETATGKRQAYISQHLMALRQAGLVSARKQGLQVYYQLSDAHTAALLTLLCGDADPTPQPPLAGCPCPHCSVVQITPV